MSEETSLDEAKKKHRKMVAADIAETALFTALMVAGAFIKIPFPMVPLTFQTVICALAGLFLGAKKGVLSMTAYMLMGLIGIPVFASGGGIFYVVKPSFGYIIGFIGGALAAGLVRGNGKPKLWRYLLGALAAFAVDYIIGIIYFIAVWVLSGYSGLGAAIVSYNVLYMPKDIVLCIFAAILAWQVVPRLNKIRNR